MKPLSSIQLLIVFVFLFVGVRTVSACSCGPTPNVLDSFEHAKNVVVVTAISVQKVDESNAVDGVKATRMVVDKVYKGILKKGDEITFAQGGGADCIWTFSEKSIGEKFLFYLSEGTKDGTWIGFGCGRSNSVERAGDDLRFLDKLTDVKNKTRISGTVNFNFPNEFTEPSREGIKIKIVGNKKTYNLLTDKDGVYEIYGLPAGKYRIVPDVPRGWKVDQFYLGYVGDLIKERDEDDEVKPITDYTIKLEDKRHSSVDFHLEINNAFRGKVYDPNGNLMKGVCVRLFPPSGIKKDFPYNADCTEADGAFELDEVPPGSYIIVANDENVISSSKPFRTLYYPGVFDLDKATVVTIGLGEFSEGLDIRVPLVEELVTIKGRFLYSDGKPVIDAFVEFAPQKEEAGFDGKSRTKTDDTGNFSLRVLKGLNGSIVGSMYTYLGQFDNCPKLDAIIRATGNTMAEPKSNTELIDGSDNVSDINLVFNFPGCKKSK